MSNIISLIIPVYRNEESIPELLAALEQLNVDLDKTLEAVFVVDGSPDNSYVLLRDALGSLNFPSQLILLSRNFGSFAAIRAGIEVGTGERFAVMAADLQEPPSLILDMDKILRNDEADVVIGVRTGRNDPFFVRLASKIFWAAYKRFVVPDMPVGGVDMFACNKSFRDQLIQLEERHSSLIAQIFWLGYRRKSVSYVRQERKHGTSAWTFSKKLNYLMDSVFSFTDLPIQLLLRIGGIATILSAILGLIVVTSKYLGGIQVPGYAALFLAIVFFGALNLFSLGIVGTYAWRTYENTKARPLHVILRSHSFVPKNVHLDKVND
jgi:glycosyltransferase involved in cell wall biosynthesis